MHAHKNRAQQQQFLAEGFKLTTEALMSGWTVDAVIGLPERLAALPAAFLSRTTVYTCTERDLTRISTQDQPEGVVAVVQMPPTAPADEPTQGPALLLWRVQDPGNLGALLRVADWFGHPRLYCTPDTVAWHNPKTVRASMGAVFRVPVRPVLTLAWLAKHAKQIAAAVLEGPAPDAALSRSCNLLLLGSESHGLPAEVLALPGLQQVSIPGGGGAESLNVAVAGGILAYALRVQGAL